MLIENNDFTSKFKVYKKKIGKEFKKTLYFEEPQDDSFHLKLLDWTEEGIFFKKYVFDETTKICLLDAKNEFEIIWGEDSLEEHVIDIKDSWLLIRDDNIKNLFRYNFKTKEKIKVLDYGKMEEVDNKNFVIENLRFFNSLDIIIGSRIPTDGVRFNFYSNSEIFIISNGKEIYNQKGILQDTINKGFIYSIYDRDSKENSIYVKNKREGYI